jgi:hypothetical protein
MNELIKELEAVSQGSAELEHMRKSLSYDSKSGLFVWLRDVGRAKTGQIAGSLHKHNRYIYITFNKKKYRAQRLAWLFTYGKSPSGEIDHINGIRHDNALSNLRDVTRLKNNQNRAIQSNNSSGVTGVAWYKRHKKWHVRIVVNGENRHLGYYGHLQDAIFARHAAEVKFGYHSNHGRIPPTRQNHSST